MNDVGQKWHMLLWLSESWSVIYNILAGHVSRMATTFCLRDSPWGACASTAAILFFYLITQYNIWFARSSFDSLGNSRHSVVSLSHFLKTCLSILPRRNNHFNAGLTYFVTKMMISWWQPTHFLLDQNQNSPLSHLFLKIPAKKARWPRNRMTMAWLNFHPLKKKKKSRSIVIFFNYFWQPPWLINFRSPSPPKKISPSGIMLFVDRGALKKKFRNN